MNKYKRRQKQVLSFIPNTAELAFIGLHKEAVDEMGRRQAKAFDEIMWYVIS